MSLGAANTYWNNARKSASVQETWLVRLWHGNESGSNYISISDHDLTVGDFYSGVVIDFGRISEKIDLLKSKSSVGNIEIRCRNLWAGQSFAKKLWGTATYFINRKVDIYSRMGDATSLGNCQQIYQGRLFNIAQESDSVIILHIEQKKPQDFISIPQTRSNDDRVYFPIVYGNYTGSASTVSSPDFLGFSTSKNLHAFDVHSINSDDIYCIDGINQVHGWHHYEKDLDQFAPLENDEVSTTAFQGGFVTKTPANLERAFKYRPSAENTSNVFDDPQYAFDGDTSTTNFAVFTITNQADNTINSKRLILDIPKIDGIFSLLKIRIKYDLSVTSDDNDIAGIILEDNSFSTTRTIASFEPTNTGTLGTTDTGFVDVTSKYVTDNEVFDKININFRFDTGVDPGATASGWCRIYEIELSCTAIFDKDGSVNGSAGSKAVDGYLNNTKNIKQLYAQKDGYAQSFTSGSGTAIEIHDIHRDLLKRFAGFDDTAGASMTGWSSLNTDRAGWDVRFWLLKPMSLESILIGLEFEGGFIFLYNPGGGRYIHVEDTYSSGDVVHTLTEKDVENISTVLTDFSEIITDITYRYQKHPANSNYVNTRIWTNGDSRTNYWPAIAGGENKKQINMQYLVDDPKADGDSNPNDSHALYYDNIQGDPKILVGCDIINKNMFNLEIGDIVQFSITDMDIKYGFTTTVYFMITRTKRKLNNLSITAREVFQV